MTEADYAVSEADAGVEGQPAPEAARREADEDPGKALSIALGLLEVEGGGGGGAAAPGAAAGPPAEPDGFASLI